MITSRAQLLKTNDEEIIKFFNAAVFRGSFTTSILLEHKEKFCGQVTDITINGEQNNLCPKSIYVLSKFSKYVEEGDCEFIASVDLNALRSEKKYYKPYILNVRNIIIPKAEHFSKEEEALFRRNLKLKDNLFIGQFTQNKDGSFAIRDIRRSDFSKLILQNGKEQQAIVYHPKITQPKDGKYYEFSWILNNVCKDEYIYLFKVDETKPIKEISARNLIAKLNEDIMSYPAGAGQKIVKMLDTLKNQLTASGKEIFIYELLQNANDYPNVVKGNKEMVDVEFHITRDSLLFLHSGAEFNERNIAAICSINDKEKTDNKETIGYKGIGFKTVFLDNNYVYLQTGKFSFRFDREETKDIVDTPWQILPIWTKYTELTASERYVFTNAENKFRVKFALRPTNEKTLRDSSQNYERMFHDVFQNERVILFIPNLSSVKVFYSNKPEPDLVCRCDSDHWQVNDFEEDIPLEVTTSINEAINDQEDSGSLKIPTKYYDFTKTKVSFACEVEGVVLKEVSDSQLYCYLPTKASWGFKFLMNTDMIPTGPRDDIEIDFSEQININAEISEIAGQKFFDWIKELCDMKKYKLNTIFSLIPVFETNIREHGKYKALIERFKNGFNSYVESKEFIPVNAHDYAFVKDVILDETGLMSSDIMDDEDFFTITGYQGTLPIKELRNDRSFNAFLKRYLKDLDFEENIWNFEDLKKLCSNFDFKEWVSKQENNNRFLEFLLKKDQIEDFHDEEIFIEESSGKLFCVSDLYYDIDTHIIDLQHFKSFLPHLSLATREYFKDNEKWKKISIPFNKFSASSFICDTLLSENWYETVESLNTWDTSFHFYSFLAKNGIVPDELNDLPFFNDEEDSEVVEDFNDKFVFFSSKEGKEICNSPWLLPVTFAFISPHYGKATLKYFEENLVVRKFTNKIIIDKIIISDDYQKDVNEAQQKSDGVSLAFIDYCYAHKELFGNGALRNYALLAYDGNGNEQWCLTEDCIYFQSDLYDSYSSKEWLNSDWMYVLNEAYLDGTANKAEYKKFLSAKFNVDELTEKKFYVDVVKRNLKNIVKNTSGETDSDGQKNIDFVKYLDDNYQLIFKEERDEDLFNEFVPVSTEISDLSLDDRIYLYDEGLADIMDNSWFPQDIVYLCNKEYGESRALLAIGCKFYEFGEFYNDVLIGELNTINDNIDSKEASISFHSFIIEHLGALTTDQQSQMAGAKVFLYGNDNASVTSSGHKILSSKARELFEKGLVEFSDLDIIDPDYKPEDNSEYWETRLGNTKFTVAHFFSWHKDNGDVFTETLQDKDLNIGFWRWLKDNITDKHIEDISVFPIILKDGSIDNSSETIYFSDEYMSGTNIEPFVKRFDKDALFLTPEYINEEDSIEEWKTFWTKVGVKYEIIDILVDAIIPNLEDIDDEGLVKLIADNRTTLEKSYEEGLIPQLTNLRVKALDGEFYNINEAIYIDCEKDEPFPYIKLPNQIFFNTAEERRLIKNIIDEVEEDCVSTLSEWQQRKLDCYLAMQADDCESVREFHYKFINDLSIIRNAKRESLKEIERIEEIYLLDRNDEFCEPSKLTMGSIYKPFFDFEVCGINSLDYINNSYSCKCSEYPGRLFRALNVHCDFLEDDINLLTNREFSLYFWGKYLTKKEASISRVKEIISNNLLDDLACIPTKDYMKTPTELYYGSEVSKYVKAIEDWENKIPLKDLLEIKLSDNSTIFDILPFKKSLDFLDALYALVTIASQERRSQLLKWMIEDDVESYYAKIQEYREDKHALWKNNRNENVQIQELYALDYWDKTLEQYFGANPRIVNKAYFPAGDLFKEACDMLGIETITSENLGMEPVGDSIYSDRDNDLKLYALVMAGIIDNENWQSLYSGYCEKLSDLALHKCKHITISYIDDRSINQDLWKFYHKEDSNDFYFVDSLDGKRVFSQFVNEYMKFLEITDVAKEVAEDILDSRKNAIEFVKEQNALMLDNSFKEELKKLDVTDNLSGNEAEMDDEQDVGYRPSFTTFLNDEELEGSGAVEKEITDDVEGEESDSVFEEGEKVRVREHERNYPGTGDASNKSAIISMPTQGSMDKGDDVDVNPTPSINSQKSNILQDEFSQIESDENYDFEEESADEDESLINTALFSENNNQHNPDSGYMGSVDKDKDYQPVGAKPYTPRTRKHPKPFTKEELKRLRSNATPLELESLCATSDEINILEQMGISPEQIADTNYLAQLRLYKNLTEDLGAQPQESMAEFVRNADDVTTHALKDGRYIHACSAARGIMYISPSVWNKMIDDKWSICVYLNGQGSNFKYISNKEDFLKLVEKDDVVIKITGKEKVDVVNQLYNGLLDGVKGTAYTLIRVASRTNMDSAFAHYIGAMAEAEDGNDAEDNNEY
ncbi:MAG: hypothetical protein LBE13_03005 [Bacteroidales bacterium]|jgi:hypothetical protein|nr:hypothetical protein [Bacteroidales bacterium]